MYLIFKSFTICYYHEFYESLLLWNVIILFYIRIGYEGVIGESGVGKSFLTNSFIRRLSKEKFITNVVNFSARTNVNYTQVYSSLLNLLYMWQVLKIRLYSILISSHNVFRGAGCDHVQTWSSKKRCVWASHGKAMHHLHRWS